MGIKGYQPSRPRLSRPLPPRWALQPASALHTFCMWQACEATNLTCIPFPTPPGAQQGGEDIRSVCTTWLLTLQVGKLRQAAAYSPEALQGCLPRTVLCRPLFRRFILFFPVSAFPQTGAKKAATFGGRAASEPTRWIPNTFPQGAPPGPACDPGPPAQYLFFKPPCSTGIRIFRPACSVPGAGISGTGNVNVVKWPLLKWSSPCSVCGP